MVEEALEHQQRRPQEWGVSPLTAESVPLSPERVDVVRTMIFTPNFSLLFCLTHFTFVNFSYPYDTNLFSYLPFILSYAFTLTDHTMKKD